VPSIESLEERGDLTSSDNEKAYENHTDAIDDQMIKI
jgi:hypothetical protein